MRGSVPSTRFVLLECSSFSQVITFMLEYCVSAIMACFLQEKPNHELDLCI
uniref:Uncharacterized protein n=1 Tax=Arundo donax TaxID=35708 RepID=A0A0A9G3M8_ARUDO